MKNKRLVMGLPLVAVLVLGIFAFKGNSPVPEKVKAAFEKKFPQAKKVKWEKESDTEWEAEFKMDGMEYSANFLEDGNWQETEHEIKEKDIPSTVATTLKRELPGYKVEEAEVSETEKGLVYEFEMEKGEEGVEVVIDSNGTLIQKKGIGRRGRT